MKHLSHSSHWNGLRVKYQQGESEAAVWKSARSPDQSPSNIDRTHTHRSPVWILSWRCRSDFLAKLLSHPACRQKKSLALLGFLVFFLGEVDAGVSGWVVYVAAIGGYVRIACR